MKFKKVYNQLRQPSKIKYSLNNQCINCDSSCSTGIDFCLPCQENLPKLSPPSLQSAQLCQYCSLPLPSKHTLFCAECLTSPPHFQRSSILSPYQYPVDRMIQQFKYQGNLINGKVLGQLLAGKIQQDYTDSLLPEIIVPVPIHYRRHWQRGFNQTIELAQTLSQRLDIPVAQKLCRRRYTRRQQQRLNKKTRQQHLKNAFITQEKIPYQHIAIVDDVVTTTATVRALSRNFALRGVERIDVWALARTLKR